LLANLYLNRLDWQVNKRREKRPVLVRYADDFVILSRPGRGAELLARLKRWLEAHGLTLNETKPRLLDVRQEGFKFDPFPNIQSHHRDGTHWAFDGWLRRLGGFILRSQGMSSVAGLICSSVGSGARLRDKAHAR
jgi:Reverse transcriptase (RNA-dependent DNA polymerase)